MKPGIRLQLIKAEKALLLALRLDKVMSFGRVNFFFGKISSWWSSQKPVNIINDFPHMTVEIRNFEISDNIDYAFENIVCTCAAT